MNRNIPIWVLLLCLLFGALFTMVFGWSVKSTLAGSDRSGRFGKAAVMVASFPTLAKSVFIDVREDTDEPVRAPRSSADLSGFVELKTRHGIDVKGLVMRAEMTHYQAHPGWRILVGAFTIDGEVKNAALALSPELEIAKVWVLTEDVIDGKEPSPPNRKFIHGFEILNDGSVIFSFDGGVSLQRFDPCSSRVWAIGGSFHHSVTIDEGEEFVWTLHSNEIIKVATATGEIVQRFSMDDIIAANPTIDILEIRKHDENDLGGNSRNTSEKWLTDPFHLNDVDPLPIALAARFDGFEAGDLLVSARSLNLVFVVDPATLEVKWWRIGATRRQHDPDWGWMGEFTVYDNRMSRDYSQIVSITPESYRTKVLFDGRKNDFYSRIRGKHQFTEEGILIVTSPQQGRVLEINPDGEVVLEFINKKPGSNEFNYVISDAIWLPPDTFNFVEDMPCEN